MDEFENGLKSAKEKFDGFSDKLSKTGEAMSNVGGTLTKAITLPLAGAGAAAGKMYMGFEDAMAKVDTIADTSQVPLYELKKSILALSNQTGISSNKIANNVYDAISAGQKTGDAVNFVEHSTKLAKAGFAEAGDALDILTTIMNAYGLEAGKVKNVSDMLIQTQNLGKTTVGQLASSMGKVIPTAKAQGVQLDSLSGAYAVMTANGVATAETTTYLNSMFNELGKQGTSAAKAFAEGTEHLKTGGLTMKEAMDSGWELTDVLSVLDEQASMTGTSISNMFGSAEAGKAAAVLWDNAEKLNEAVGKMRESSGATEIAFEKLQTKSVAIEKAINQLKNTIIDLGGTVMSVLAPVIESLSEKIASFTEWFANLDDGSKKFIVTLGLVSAAVGPVLIVIGKIITALSTIGGAISSVVSLVSGGITSIIGIGSKLMGGIQSLFALIMAHPVVAVVTAIIAAVVLLWQNCEAFRDAVGAIWDAIVGFFQAAAEGIKAAFDGVVEFFSGVWEGIQGIFQGVAEFFGGIFQAAAEIVQTVWGAVVDFFSAIWEGIQSVFSTVAEVLGGFFQAAAEVVQAAWSAVVAFFSGVWEGIKGVFSTVAEVLGGFFSAAVEAVQAAWSAVVEFFSGIWQGIQNVFSVVADVLGGFFQTAWEAVQSVWNAAVDFFTGIVEGIKSVFEALKQFLGDVFKAAWEAIQAVWEGAKEFFTGVGEAIQSVFEGVTEFLSEAFKKAYEAVKSVWEAAKEFFSGVWNAIKEGASAAGEFIGSTLKKAWEAVKSAWDGAKSFFSGVWEGIKGVFSNALDHFKGIGSNIMNGLISGIKEKVASVKNAVGNVVDGIKNVFTGKKGFDEHSPSKWSNQVFRNLLEGGIGGLDAGTRSLMREVDSIVGRVKSGMDFGASTVSVNANYSGAGRYGAQNAAGRTGPGWGSTTVNIYSPEAVDGVQAARVWKKEVQKMSVAYI